MAVVLRRIVVIAVRTFVVSGVLGAAVLARLLHLLEASRFHRVFGGEGGAWVRVGG
jgi:hypothetical protein